MIPQPFVTFVGFVVNPFFLGALLCLCASRSETGARSAPYDNLRGLRVLRGEVSFFLIALATSKRSWLK